MIRNIVFDIGNVLTDFRWNDFLLDKGYDQQMVDRIGRASVLTDTWPELDRGVWTWDEVLDGFVRNDPEIEQVLRDAFESMENMVTIREYAIPWVKEFKDKGYQVYYLSNFSEKVERECSDALAFLPYMDGGILSYKVQLIKPDPAIYRELLKMYDLKPAECVFLDDTFANIVAAEMAGYHGIHFKTKEQAIAELKKFGV